MGHSEAIWIQPTTPKMTSVGIAASAPGISGISAAGEKQYLGRRPRYCGWKKSCTTLDG